jgi:hypothetical protein
MQHLPRREGGDLAPSCVDVDRLRRSGVDGGGGGVDSVVGAVSFSCSFSSFSFFLVGSVPLHLLDALSVSPLSSFCFFCSMVGSLVLVITLRQCVRGKKKEKKDDDESLPPQ